MKLGEIDEKLKLAQVYKYVSQLEIEKNKRRNGVYHDFKDDDDFYSKKVIQYNDTIERLNSLKTTKINNMFKATAIGVHVVLIIAFVMIIKG